MLLFIVLLLIFRIIFLGFCKISLQKACLIKRFFVAILGEILSTFCNADFSKNNSETDNPPMRKMIRLNLQKTSWE